MYGVVYVHDMFGSVSEEWNDCSDLTRIAMFWRYGGLARSEVLNALATTAQTDLDDVNYKRLCDCIQVSLAALNHMAKATRFEILFCELSMPERYLACEIIWGRALRKKNRCASFQQREGYPLTSCNSDEKYAMIYELDHEPFLTEDERKWKQITLAMQTGPAAAYSCDHPDCVPIGLQQVNYCETCFCCWTEIPCKGDLHDSSFFSPIPDVFECPDCKVAN